MKMDPRLQSWLDGELGFDDLPESLRAEASAWTGVLDDVRAVAAPGAAPGATGRIMEAIRAEALEPPSVLARLGSGMLWVVRPRSIPVPPLAAAAALALVVWMGVRLAAGDGADAGVVADGRVYVQFVIAAPGASTVALAGDFNEWDPSIELSDPDNDGVWSARVALEAGVHEYMFVIDGTEWRPDPNALSWAEDGFGRLNSLVAVGPLDET